MPSLTDLPPNPTERYERFLKLQEERQEILVQAYAAAFAGDLQQVADLQRRAGEIDEACRQIIRSLAAL